MSIRINRGSGEQEPLQAGERACTVHMGDGSIWRIAGDIPHHIDRQVELVERHLHRGRVEHELLAVIRQVVADAERSEYRAAPTASPARSDLPVSWYGQVAYTAGTGGLFF
ncbi:hypothetical protein SAMN05216266_1109 [Amycolatopsis marina]|uniref:Uncharacterized protein n=1 Tax=Amycolatopsis marina TaxID=490629 RepID=A0A1I1ATN9_9PSEU|nr:hypothetical protein [Amycolatopsis marina]SFB39683.1 hypothetical protein SAMN05216266_1109 [Amycolatopsis marina]